MPPLPAELAGHDAVTVFVLNQCDKLTPEEQAKVRKATGPYAGMVIANTAKAKGYSK
jgi:hypothetical protein